MEVSSEYAVQMHGITKTFGSFKALDKVQLDVKKQTIHAILGENGAGKSTLMNVLYGLYQADEGEIYLNGEKVNISNPTEAIKHGIGMVHQHFMLVENFTVTENIVLGDEVCGAAGILDPKRAREEVTKIVEEYGLEVDPDAKIEDISVGMQQRVEILKVLYRGAETLILDEPTAVLTPQEIEKLIEIMHDLVRKGKTIIIITHKLKEIMSSADVCTIIRRGVYMGTVNVSETNEEELASKMVGRHVEFVVEKAPAHPGKLVLSIDDLHVKDDRGIEKVRGLSLQVHAGEIVGIAGIDGNGQDELANALDGLTKVESGTISINGTEIQNTSIKNVLNHSVATIPADRQRWGMVLPLPWLRTWCSIRTMKSVLVKALSSITTPCVHLRVSLLRNTTSVPMIAKIMKRVDSPAVTSRRPLLLVKFLVSRIFWWLSNQHAAWTLALSNSYIRRLCASVTAVQQFCSFHLSLTRS